jgi:UDP-glucuronate decarboxylase
MQIDDGRVVTNFIVQALRGRPVTVFGDGTQSRSFCFVSDLIDGLHSLFHSSAEVTGPINLGNPAEFTMLELAEMVISLANSKSEIVLQDLPSDDPKQRKPDISKAKELLDWSPVYTLDYGIKKTAEYFKSILC